MNGYLFVIQVCSNINSCYRSSRPEVSSKKDARKMSQNSQENTSDSLYFFDKVAGHSMQLYRKTDSGTGVFLLILQNFQGGEISRDS